ncbi:MAG: hypothetical protein IJI92_05585 [Erysipelotrichaceae bacterium]|nr:hypothetical protein [Erysipelotrichaceae bacterium]
MKKVIMILLLLLCLCSCAAENTESSESPSVTPLTDSWREGMDDYEQLEIALIGGISPEFSLEDILKRAREELGLELISEIDEDHIVQGEKADLEYVYLIIPAKDTDLAIGSLDPLHDCMDEIYYMEENSAPVIYIESTDGMTPRGLIECVRHRGNDSDVTHMYTGRNYGTGALRTDYLMGVVDITRYQEFTSGEIGFLGQLVFDYICYDIPEISEKIQVGEYSVHTMDEMMREGKMYLIYSITDADGNEQCLLAVNYESKTREFRLLQTYDMENWFEPDTAQG